MAGRLVCIHHHSRQQFLKMACQTRDGIRIEAAAVVDDQQLELLTRHHFNRQGVVRLFASVEITHAEGARCGGQTGLHRVVFEDQDALKQRSARRNLSLTLDLQQRGVGVFVLG